MGIGLSFGGVNGIPGPTGKGLTIPPPGPPILGGLIGKGRMPPGGATGLPMFIGLPIEGGLPIEIGIGGLIGIGPDPGPLFNIGLPPRIGNGGPSLPLALLIALFKKLILINLSL
jgi:hypothetical protein